MPQRAERVSCPAARWTCTTASRRSSVPTPKLAGRRRYTNTPESVPAATLPSGYAAAEKLIRRVCGPRRPVLADRLLDVLCTSGFQGAPALEYLAECLLWYLAGRDVVPVASKLK